MEPEIGSEAYYAAGAFEERDRPWAKQPGWQVAVATRRPRLFILRRLLRRLIP